MSPAERDRFLGNIKADAERLSQLVTRLLDLARADMAQPDPDAEIDALTVIRQLADAFEGPGLRVVLAQTQALPLVSVPPSTIEAVLTTLMDNARQAGADRIDIHVEGLAEGLGITVSDNGRGIPAADAERIFEPFFTTRRATGGTGLGLAISASLLRTAGGSIRLVRSDTAGSCFAVVVPAAGKPVGPLPSARR